MALRHFFIGRTIGFAVVCAVVLTGTFYHAERIVEIDPNGSGGRIATSINSTQTDTSSAVKILFGGDIFLDRAVRTRIEKSGIDYPWRDIEPLLAEYPYKIANLEGPVMETPQAATADSFTFAFQPEYVKHLADLGFTAVSLANNHTLNQDTAGLAATRRALRDMKLGYFGDPSNAASSSFLEMELNGRMIAFVGEHDLIQQGQDDILKTIIDLGAKGDFVVVYPHWGVEYVTSTVTSERARAHKLIDAGADLVIGSHPHVIQSIEIYEGKPVFYSLGNFLFDQYFSFETMHGLLVGMELSPASGDAGTLATFTLIPTEQDRTYQIHEAGGSVRQVLLNGIADGSDVTPQMKSDIKKGMFSLVVK